MKHAVITGANRGIGLELTKQLIQQDYQVTALCRQSSAELDSCSNVRVVSGFEITNPDSIRQSCQSLGDQPIDLLINNAGRLRRVSLEDMNNESIEEINTQFKINALGPVLVTSACMNQLKSGAKVALITSRMGSIEDNTSGSHYAYRMSKSALNMAGKSMAVDLEPKGVAVAILHPGWIQTDMTAHAGNDTPDNAARDLLQRIDELSLETSGTFWHANGTILGW